MARQYDILEHGLMLADRRRITAYVDAIKEAVRPGNIVADVGSGTGIFALAACDAGASRVYAMETGGIAYIGRAIVDANRCGDRVSFINERSDRVHLPESVNVLVLDVRGVLPDSQIPIALDARRRHLRPRGRIVPASDEIWAVPVTAQELFDRQIGVWAESQCGVDVSCVRSVAARQWVKARFSTEQFLAEPIQLGTIDYANDDTARFQSRAEWRLLAGSRCHGFAVWFESLLADRVRLSNRPGDPELLYGQGYFPLPEAIYAGVKTHIVLDFCGFDSDDDYEWRWHAKVTNGSDASKCHSLDDWPAADRR